MEEEEHKLLHELISRDLCAFLGEDLRKAIEEEAIRRRNQPSQSGRRRTSRPRVDDYWLTRWGQMLQDPEARVPGTYAFKKFRRKFRIPCALFLDFLVPAVKACNLFEMKYESAIPIEIKCMIGLRILGRGSCACDMEELSGVGESTCNTIFHSFIRGMVKHFYTGWVRPPVGERLAKVMQTYSRLGFPGAVGSIDCTHIFWAKCPVAMTNLCMGKEKFPSLSFEVVVDHEGSIHSCTEGFWGTCTDKMIVVNDPYAKEIADGLYKEVEFSLYNEDGTFTTFRGGYLISDCGYTRLWIFQMPLAHAHDPRSVYWSEFLESVRKDVERTFGILKARFLFLAHRIQYHDPETITAAMRCACILHNMLLAHDNMEEEDWENVDSDGDDEVEEAEGGGVQEGALVGGPAAANPNSGLGIVTHTRDASIVSYSPRLYTSLQNALITHFEYAYRRGCVVWPRGFSPQQRALFPTINAATSANVLYVAPSWYMARGLDGEYNVDIGKGLFTSIKLSPQTRLLNFVGEVVPREAYQQRVEAGRGGYAILLNAHSVLDCFNFKARCHASMTNSPRHLRTGAPGLPEQPASNCKIVISNSITGVVRLETTQAVQSNTELFWNYGDEYLYP